MNTGVISSRYASALLEYVRQTGNGARLCSQAQTILRTGEIPDRLEPELERFLRLLSDNGRMEYVRFILNTFVRLYHESVGEKVARLTTVSPDAGLQKRVKEFLEKRGNCRVELETVTNPDIIGGFIVEIDDYVLDASVRRQLSLMHRELVDKNNRIV